MSLVLAGLLTEGQPAVRSRAELKRVSHAQGCDNIPNRKHQTSHLWNRALRALLGSKSSWFTPPKQPFLSQEIFTADLFLFFSLRIHSQLWRFCHPHSCYTVGNSLRHAGENQRKRTEVQLLAASMTQETFKSLGSLLQQRIFSHFDGNHSYHSKRNKKRKVLCLLLQKSRAEAEKVLSSHANSSGDLAHCYKLKFYVSRI